MSTLFWYDWAGFIGVVLVLLAFLLLQAHKLHGNGITYQLMNVFGALGVALSLLFGSFNASAFALEIAWMAIGIFGIVRSARRRQTERMTRPDA
ncbi:CBU_0592 family membrane protein [Frateuria terrea]|uniref:CBU-0592-like domain-containing protein n=1 Tax=Frateuria terrea TaxID=529704 RepID=A0A1H6YH95_9GAMM|nr:hypothetical protein [Frateuria terrea]SEJ36612.1 hypothetical protein SAMN04487997_3166 [Frateuria terrea]SFP48701.1 hypothetical protein SAMN02927913_2275 [Frateuria terrea]